MASASAQDSQSRQMLAGIPEKSSRGEVPSA
jgi:hypothetical protein